MFNKKNLVKLLKNWLVICQSIGDLFFINLIVDIDSRTNSTKPVFLPPHSSSNGLKKSTLSPTIYACIEFIATIVKKKASYIIVVVAKEKELMANFAQEITKLFYYKNFVS